MHSLLPPPTPSPSPGDPGHPLPGSWLQTWLPGGTCSPRPRPQLPIDSLTLKSGRINARSELRRGKASSRHSKTHSQGGHQKVESRDGAGKSLKLTLTPKLFPFTFTDKETQAQRGQFKVNQCQSQGSALLDKSAPTNTDSSSRRDISSNSSFASNFMCDSRTRQFTLLGLSFSFIK